MSKKVKITHIANLHYPYYEKWDKDRNYVEFELGNIDISMANSLRRIMLANVPTIGFRTEPYKNSMVSIKINDSPLHNQMLSHRIAMIPIYITSPDKFVPEDYLYIIDVKNDSLNLRNITTDDINVKHIPTNKFLSQKDVRKMFPHDSITGDPILITILRSKYYIKFKENPDIMNAYNTAFNNSDTNKKTNDILLNDIDNEEDDSTETSVLKDSKTVKKVDKNNSIETESITKSQSNIQDVGRLYIEAKACEIMDDKEREKAYTLLDKRGNGYPWKLEELDESHRPRLYKAVPEKVWVNGVQAIRLV